MFYLCDVKPELGTKILYLHGAKVTHRRDPPGGRPGHLRTATDSLWNTEPTGFSNKD